MNQIDAMWQAIALLEELAKAGNEDAQEVLGPLMKIVYRMTRQKVNQQKYRGAQKGTP